MRQDEKQICSRCCLHDNAERFSRSRKGYPWATWEPGEAPTAASAVGVLVLAFVVEAVAVDSRHPVGTAGIAAAQPVVAVGTVACLELVVAVPETKVALAF